MSYVYILKSDRYGRYYIGCTGNLKQRLDFHNSGRVFSTKAYAPWKLVYSEEFVELKKTRMRERQIKSWKKRAAIERLMLKKD